MPFDAHQSDDGVSGGRCPTHRNRREEIKGLSTQEAKIEVMLSTKWRSACRSGAANNSYRKPCPAAARRDQGRAGA
jgi:hypothetical protein